MQAACARCGRTDGPLVLAEGGSICAVCEAEGAEAEALDLARWTAAIAPLLALGTSAVLALAGCFPTIGLIAAPLSAMVALAAVVLGVRNFLVEEAEELQRTVLVLSGAFGVLGGVAMFPVAGFAFLTTLGGR